MMAKFGSGSALRAVWRIRDVLSRILDPDFYPSRIPDPKTAMKDRGEKIFFS